MKIQITSDFRNFKKGERIAVFPRKVNYWVGANGTGKSTLASLILTALKDKDAKLVPKHLWMAETTTRHVTLTDCDEITGLSFVSDKLRQSQYVDMDSLISQGIGRIWSSEGQNAQQDIVKLIEHMDDPNHLTILDELDGHLDYRSKVLYFDGLLRKIKGTVIVVTHDSYFLAGQNVFDFADRKRKTGEAYYAEQRAQVFGKK